MATVIDMVGPRGTVSVLCACSEPDTLIPMLALAKQVKIGVADGDKVSTYGAQLPYNRDRPHRRFLAPPLRAFD